jgi:hypothetical protein
LLLTSKIKQEVFMSIKSSIQVIAILFLAFIVVSCNDNSVGNLNDHGGGLKQQVINRQVLQRMNSPNGNNK